jgi:hypothetical protein
MERINTIKQKTAVIATNKMASILLTSLIFAAIISYMFLANMTVRTITILQKTKKQMQSLSVKVSEMESQRLAIENNVSTEKALKLGFVEVNNTTFIMKNSRSKSEGASLSIKMN